MSEATPSPPADAHVLAAIDRHFRGAGRAADELAMRAHLADCAACRQHYERRLAFARLDPRALPAADRLGRALGYRVRPPRALSLGLGAALAAAMLALMVPRLSRTPPAEFTARGGAARSTDLLIYAVEKDAPRLVGAQIPRGAELAFAYVNGTGRQRLAVFAVDERRRVFWFFPRWEQAEDNPSAGPIDAAPGVHELPLATRHAFDRGRLWIYGIFTDEALSVRALEAQVSAAPELGKRLPLAQATQVVRELEVRP
jgi:hypothetical protein